MDKAITILSGGLDSTVSTLLAQKELDVVVALTFDYGQRAATNEIKVAKEFCKSNGIAHKVYKLDFLSDLTTNALTNKTSTLPALSNRDIEEGGAKTKQSAAAVWVPNRNAIFINIAAGIAEEKKIPWIITGFNLEEAETFPDNSQEFIDKTNAVLKLSTLTKPKVKSFVHNMTKTEIMKMALALGVDPLVLWVCYEGGNSWCEKCESCLRTRRAMKNCEI